VPPAPPFEPSTHPTSLGRSSCFGLRCHFPDRDLAGLLGLKQRCWGVLKQYESTPSSLPHSDSSAYRLGSPSLVEKRTFWETLIRPSTLNPIYIKGTVKF